MNVSDCAAHHPNTASHEQVISAFRAALAMARAESASSSGDMPAARAALRAAADTCHGLLAERWAQTQAGDAGGFGRLRGVMYLSL